MPRLRTVSTAPTPVETNAGNGSVFGALWRQRAIVLGCFVAAMIAGVLIIVFSPVRYTASTSILLDPRLGKSVGADPTQPGFVTDTSAIDSQVKLLTSQTVLTRVAKSLDLENDAEFSGKKFSIMRLLGIAGPQQPGVDLKALENAITIKKPERTYLVEIQVSASTPDLSASIANALAEAYNDDQISSRVGSARNDARFIAQKREQLRKQIEEADRKIEAYKSANNIVSTDGLRSNEQQVTDLTRELGTSRGKLSELKARAEQVAAIARAGKLDASTDALKSPTIDRLRGQQADAEREQAKLAETLGPRHPALLESRAQVQRVRELIGAELTRLRQSAEGDYQTEKRNESQLVAELDRIKRQSTDTSSKIVPLRQMERDVDALRQSDDRFSRIGDTLTQQEADTPPARVVAAARPPVSPSWPRRSLILAVAAAVGLFVGLGLALLRDATMRPRVVPVAVAREAPQPVRAKRRDAWADEEIETPTRVVDAMSRRRTTVAARVPVEAPATEEDYYRSLRRRQSTRRGRMVWS